MFCFNIQEILKNICYCFVDYLNISETAHIFIFIFTPLPYVGMHNYGQVRFKIPYFGTLAQS